MIPMRDDEIVNRQITGFLSFQRYAQIKMLRLTFIIHLSFRSSASTSFYSIMEVGSFFAVAIANKEV